MLLKDKHFYSCPDNKIWDSPFNAGIFFVLNTEIGLKIMHSWLTTYDKNRWKKKDNIWKASCRWASTCYEQGSFVKNILPKYSNYIHSFPWRFFQSFYSDLKKNKSRVFTLHFTGISAEEELHAFLKNKIKRKTRKRS